MKTFATRWVHRIGALWLLCVIACMPVATLAAENTGTVLMMSGAATLEHAGSVRPLHEGDVVGVRDIVATGADGHAYLRFPDGSLVILRPSSRFEVEAYAYDAAAPARAQVRFVLKAGVMRSITGTGLHDHKDRYRLNTPLAAIGVRGTDFTTYVGPDVVRVSVHLGGIAMAPYGAGCDPAALGACAGPNVQELFANSALMLELRNGQVMPRRLPAGQGAPDSISPPLDREPAAGKAARDGGRLQETLAVERIDALSALSAQTQTGETAVVPPPVPNIGLAWGRWAVVAGLPAPAFSRNLPADKQEVAFNAVYSLVRDKGFTLPGTGQYSFNLQSGEAWRMGRDGAPQALGIVGGTLGVDFARRSFATRLDLTGADTGWTILGAGDITRDGRLVSAYLAGSNANIRGALGGQEANAAAYIFQRTVGSDQLYGATYWARH